LDPLPHRPVILIAERDQKVRELQTFFLEKAGFSVEFADDGQAALDRAIELRPALVVTEILIPTLDGLSLCRRLKELPETGKVPVVVFSILGAASRAEEAGASRFLRKPLIESVFVPAIQELIADQSNAKEHRWTSDQ
jgi:CheY-like chemotaxis protein